MVRNVPYFAISVKNTVNDCQNFPKNTFLYKYTLSKNMKGVFTLLDDKCFWYKGSVHHRELVFIQNSAEPVLVYMTKTDVHSYDRFSRLKSFDGDFAIVKILSLLKALYLIVFVRFLHILSCLSCGDDTLVSKQLVKYSMGSLLF